MAVRPLRDAPDLAAHTGFILAEDEMMKDHFSDITVPGPPSKPPIKVGVWYRWPEGERQIRYPFIAIDLLSADPAYDLFTSDYYVPREDLYRPSISPTMPAPPGGWATQGYAVRNPLPFRLTYQVAVHCRNAHHDRYLHSIFKTDALPARPFWLWCAADEKWRRSELVSTVVSDLSETTESATKRIFRKVYTMTVMAEVPQDRFVDSVAYQALRVFIPVVDREYFDTYRETILNDQPDPLADFTVEERAEQGEYTHVWHEGHTLPASSG